MELRRRRRRRRRDSGAGGSDAPLADAAVAIYASDALVVCCGAGMSAESGLPVYADRRREYQRFASPRCGPEALARYWSGCARQFLGAEPHAGYRVLQRIWRDREQRGRATVFLTTNVDGLLAKAGVPAPTIHEVHGSALRWQCSARCGEPAVAFPPAPSKSAPLPCGACGALRRPSVLLFHDGGWDEGRATQRRCEHALSEVLEQLRGRPGGGTLCILEIGCGDAVPTLRDRAEQLTADALALPSPQHVAHVRINPDDLLAESVCREGARWRFLSFVARAAGTLVDIEAHRPEPPGAGRTGKRARRKGAGDPQGPPEVRRARASARNGT